MKAGADVNAPAAEERGITALQGAAIQGNLRIAVMLLKAGADVNAPPAEYGGRKALEGAAEHGRLDMVQLLLNAGAKLDASEDGRNCKAMKLAKSEGHITVARLLWSACSTGDEIETDIVMEDACGTGNEMEMDVVME
ncbi:ankyrin [Wilcoxina mikolae CBS 423.85]|nr:ankyrin [Wilcoxina mikolae CBS 423.85]